jgi:peptidoglycan DL-endopeptidase CwlO
MEAHGPPRRHAWGPGARDAALRRTRRLSRAVAVTAAGAFGLCSVVAAQAFKGHTGRRVAASGAAVAAAPSPAATSRHAPAVAVAPPQHVPAIAGDPGSLSPPPAPPAAAPDPSPPPSAAPAPAPAPAPPVSGGS